MFTNIPHLGGQGEVVAIVGIRPKSIILNFRNALRQGNLSFAIFESIFADRCNSITFSSAGKDYLTAFKVGASLIFDS